jgi:hypothetical protein
MSLNTNGWDYIYTLNVNKLNSLIASKYVPIVSVCNCVVIPEEFAIPYAQTHF